MKTAIVTLKSESPYSQSRHYDVPSLEGESDKAYEERTWRERLHVTEDGHVFIPPMAFKNCLSDAAKFLGEKIQGRGAKTWTKHFESGVLVMDPLVLPIKKDDVKGERLFVPSDGIRGGGKRVEKIFPYISSWTGDVVFHILNPEIEPKVFEKHLDQAGKFIGIGRFRPHKNGYYGRFSIVKIDWK